MNIKWIIILIISWNLWVAITYAYDKRAARERVWRIPESRLLLMTWFLGGIGAAGAAYLCRHKTTKIKFKISFIVSGLLTSLVLFGLVTLL